ncbi:SufE family protein [Psychromonas sp. B3M02]|uniref:SufE family protein n=1 Tax=Psychromonas sp. B3M02 TaxID=2267226 RepID=UPI00215D6B6C|nr:SufE family protein [Psychromonas sp. B3M02]
MQKLTSITQFEELKAAFMANKSWDAQYRLIIQLGRVLAPFPEQMKLASNQVRGCESTAWLICTENNGLYTFTMESEARIVRGLMQIVAIIFNNKSAQEIALIDCDELFAELGLLNHLSPSRSNGLFSIINTIKGVNSID